MATSGLFGSSRQLRLGSRGAESAPRKITRGNSLQLLLYDSVHHTGCYWILNVPVMPNALLAAGKGEPVTGVNVPVEGLMVCTDHARGTVVPKLPRTITQPKCVLP